MNVTITNISLDADRFRVYIKLSNGVEENNLFMPQVTSTEIIAWATERKLYYEELEAKELELQSALNNLEL